MATATPAAIMAYSIAVAPLTARLNLFRQVQIRQFTADLREGILKISLGWRVVIFIGVRRAVTIERARRVIEAVRERDRVDGDAEAFGVVADFGHAVVGDGQSGRTRRRAQHVGADAAIRRLVGAVIVTARLPAIVLTVN